MKWLKSNTLFLKNHFKEIQDTTYTLYKNYKNLRFLTSFLWLKLSYLLDTPWLVALRHKKKIGNLAYGETPLFSLATIGEAISLCKDDHVIELGSGSGYTSLWLATVIGCQVTAIEKIPVFCWRLSRTAKRFRIANLEVLCEDFFYCDLTQATVVYACLSNLPDKLIQKLSENLSKLPNSTKIITVSYPLSSNNERKIILHKRLSIQFSWGYCDVYIQSSEYKQLQKTPITYTDGVKPLTNTPLTRNTTVI